MDLLDRISLIVAELLGGDKELPQQHINAKGIDSMQGVWAQEVKYLISPPCTVEPSGEFGHRELHRLISSP